jgi:hypothetical protein
MAWGRRFRTKSGGASSLGPRGMGGCRVAQGVSGGNVSFSRIGPCDFLTPANETK